MSEGEKRILARSQVFPVIEEFIRNHNLHGSAINAFHGLDTKRIDVLVTQFINYCANEEFLAFLEAHQIEQC